MGIKINWSILLIRIPFTLLSFLQRERPSIFPRKEQWGLLPVTSSPLLFEYPPMRRTDLSNWWKCRKDTEHVGPRPAVICSLFLWQHGKCDSVGRSKKYISPSSPNCAPRFSFSSSKADRSEAPKQKVLLRRYTYGPDKKWGCQTSKSRILSIEKVQITHPRGRKGTVHAQKQISWDGRKLDIFFHFISFLLTCYNVVEENTPITQNKLALGRQAIFINSKVAIY